MTRPRRSPLIRSARQASNAAKLSEIFGNKKTRHCAGYSKLRCNRGPYQGPGR